MQYLLYGYHDGKVTGSGTYDHQYEAMIEIADQYHNYDEMELVLKYKNSEVLVAHVMGEDTAIQYARDTQREREMRESV